MNLTELQIQLRSIEEHISDLQTEIEKMKPQPEDEKKVMFEKITEMAAKFPLENRRFSKTSITDVKAYLCCLSYILHADDSKIYDKLLFLCRLSNGMGHSIPSEDIFRMGLEIDEKYFDKTCAELKEQKYSLLTDALILVNITEEATEASFRVIADIARIFECEKEDLRAAAMVAKAVLVEDFNVLKQIPVPSQNHWMGKFEHHIPSSWIKSQRIQCGKICTEKKIISSPYLHLRPDRPEIETASTDACVIKKQLPSGAIVRKGDVLVSYEEKVKKYKPKEDPFYSAFGSIFEGLDAFAETVVEKKTLNAPCDGVVFFAESTNKDSTKELIEKYLEVYVVSYFDEYAAFCDWHKKK